MNSIQIKLVLAAMLWVSTGCAEAPAEPELPCATDTIGTVEQIASLPPRTEGMIFDEQGRLFVTAKDALFEVYSDGRTRKIVDNTGAIGLAWWQDAIAMATFGATSGKANDGAIVLVDPDSGVTETIGPALQNPNFLVPTPWNDLLISDDFQTSIWSLGTDGSLETWMHPITSPNGMAIDTERSRIFVATTFGDEATGEIVTSTAIDQHKPHMESQTIERSYPRGAAPDGLAIDTHRRVYVALNTLGTLERILPDGNNEVITDEVLGIASMAFVPQNAAEAHGFDRCSLYATQLLGGAIWRIDVAALNAP